MHLDDAGLPRPEPEYIFHASRKWSLDFAWWFCVVETREEVKLALEVEGGTFRKHGGHRGVSKFLSDKEKYNTLAIERWHLLRVFPAELDRRRNEGIDLVSAFLKPVWR